MNRCTIDYKTIKSTQPEIISRIIEIDEESPNCFREMDRLLRSDQVVASFILRVANSPIYNRSQPIRTLPIAISLLGINIIRSLVILAFSRSVFSKNKNALVRTHIWQHSLLVAIASYNICSELGKSADCEEAFVAGLVHDIGKILLFTHARKDYMDALTYALESDCSSREAEQRFLGTDHYQIGEQAVRAWKLPSQFQLYIGTDLDQLAPGQAENKILLWLAIANNLIKGAGIGANPCDLDVRKEKLIAYGLNEEYADYLLDEAFFQKLIDDEIYQFCANDHS
ncbi:metal dependent phosphohydrolase [Nitrosomonas eutropha]|uniref:Metal dependent phosphohydrolase n=1 Tax=Nitrosomonas eutropha TaxID=916 RepID=A0A1I7F4F2_9PROT|nr:HDOD domain-containing protein [Nitrosomonas eutropha]SFU31098.1 metal dependent phosphohydrolase [Nitrosomonas eutropha]